MHHPSCYIDLLLIQFLAGLSSIPRLGLRYHSPLNTPPGRDHGLDPEQAQPDFQAYHKTQESRSLFVRLDVQQKGVVYYELKVADVEILMVSDSFTLKRT